jgi:hypothetical protein
MRSGVYNNTTERFKEFCSGKGCKNLGKTLLKIKYINKTGLFCDSCAAGLLDHGLAFKEEGTCKRSDSESENNELIQKEKQPEIRGQTSSNTIEAKSYSQQIRQEDNDSSAIFDFDNYDSVLPEQTFAKYDTRPLPQPISNHDQQNIERLGPTQIGEITKYETAEMYGRSVDEINKLLPTSYSHY